MTTFRCNSVFSLGRVVATAIFGLCVLLAPSAWAQVEESLTLFDGYTVTYMGTSDYVRPIDGQPGRAMHVVVPELSDSPRDFVPIADNLFEEAFLPLLVGADFNHAMVVQWRPEPEGADQLQYGEDVYYDRRPDGSWARVSHLSQTPERSAFGALDEASTQMIGDHEVALLPPALGYIYRYERPAILVRCALQVDLTDDEALLGFITDLLATEGRSGALGDMLVAHPGAALVLYVSNELPANRFQSTLTRSMLIPSDVVQRSLNQEGGNP